MTEQLASLVPILTGDSVADDRLKHLWPEVKNKKTPKNKNPTSYIRTSTQLWLNAPKKKKRKKRGTAMTRVFWMLLVEVFQTGTLKMCLEKCH